MSVMIDLGAFNIKKFVINKFGKAEFASAIFNGTLCC